MVTRKRSIAEASTLEMVTTEPKLIGDGEYCPRHKTRIYVAVDYMGTRFRVGDHVALYTGGKEWLCVLETLYKDDKNVAMFKCRWFWNLQDIKEFEGEQRQEMRPSKCPSHELICGDHRDTNLVESISRKCDVLSYDNFALVKKQVMKSDSQWKKTYFCERQYYHKVNRFSELNSSLFPGDPIPLELRRAAGLPDLPPTDMDPNPDYSNAYSEPELITATKKNGKGPKFEQVEGQKLVLW